MDGFIEIMEIVERRCAMPIGCNGCPAEKNLVCAFGNTANNHDWKKIAEGFVQWEKRNKKRYPTWIQWQDKAFPDRPKHIDPCVFVRCPHQRRCGSCLSESIPEHIAVKLGIEPIDA